MAKEHTIHIKADGGSGSSDSPEGDGSLFSDEALDNAAEALRKNTEALGNVDEQIEEELGVFDSNDSGRAAGPGDNEDVEEIESWMEGFKRVLGLLHSGAVAITGVNSRVTKVLSAAKRVIASYSQHLQAAAAAQAAATAATQQTTQAQTGARGAMGAVTGFLVKVVGSLSVFGKALLFATKIAGVVALGLGAIAMAGKALVALINRLKDVAGDFSGALKAAEANARVVVLRQRMESARRVGGELASLEESKGTLSAELIELKTNIIDAFSGPLSIFVESITIALKAINAILNILNAILEFIAEVASSITKVFEDWAFIGPIAKSLRRWLDDQNNAFSKNLVTGQVLDMFGDENDFLPVGRNDRTEQRFLN